MVPLLAAIVFVQASPDTGLRRAETPAPAGLVVAIPAMGDRGVRIDGRLDEAVWAGAATLREFSEYLPNDNRPADDSTTVLVWYSPTAIYFGIRAYQDSASVRATLADRDKITGDDYVEILLDTFNDRRQALVFGANPLGVQADGTLRDAAQQNINITSSAVTGAYALDLSPDYVYESKGHQTAWGYEVEIRIPFKTLRYQARNAQDWGLNVVRFVQATGHQLTWTRVLQTRASFLGQSGTLAGLSGLERGLVLDLTPEATSTLTGAEQPAGWHYGGGDPRLGVTARWGITPSLSLDATARPDFSQIESDAPQLQPDPRSALFFPEKRPFFLDGLELFQTPLSVIYTRRLVDPVAAVKLTGKAGSTTVAALSGVDGTDASRTGTDHPVLNAVRLRQDLGAGSNAGVVYTDRVDGASFNRLATADGRLVLGPAWTLTFQGGGSATRDSSAAPVSWSPVWDAYVVRSGRRFGLKAETFGVGDAFHAGSGFISRGDVVQNVVTPSVTIAGAPGSWLESFTGDVFLSLTWDRFRRFTTGKPPETRQADFSFAVTLRGGWHVGTGVSVESFGYPDQLYGSYWIERVRGTAVDTVPFTGQTRIPNLDLGANVRTPEFRSFSLSAFLLTGNDENFYEWATARIFYGSLDLTWRPTEQLRAELLYNHQQVIRRDGGSTVGLIRVPRLKVEYQLSRPIFFRVIGQYTSSKVDALRDDSRTGGAILIRDPATGAFTRTTPATSNTFRVDWLFSYRPTPGTVVFLGYGNTLAEPTPFRFRALARQTDGFFVKASYLIRG